MEVLGVTDWIAVSAVVSSLLLFFYTRRTRKDPKRILDLGLIYMIFTAVDLGFMFHWMPMPAEQRVIAPEISWIGAIVLMFAAIVPTTPAKSVIAGLIAVSMNPLSMLIARARGAWHFDSATDVVLMHYPDYLLVGVAVVISRVVTSLGQQVARRGRWAATSSVSSSAAAEWVRSTRPRTGCWRARQQSN